MAEERVVHCWAGRREELEAADPENYWRSAEWQSGEDGICLRLDGHDGPHEFTPTDQIVLRFSEESDAAGALHCEGG